MAFRLDFSGQADEVALAALQADEATAPKPREDDGARAARIARETPSYHGTAIELPEVKRAE